MFKKREKIIKKMKEIYVMSLFKQKVRPSHSFLYLFCFVFMRRAVSSYIIHCTVQHWIHLLADVQNVFEYFIILT